jgi:integrase
MGMKFGPTSVNLAVKVMKTAYNWAPKRELFTGLNPASEIEKFPESSRDRFLQPDELVKLNRALETEKNQDLVDFITIALGSAARHSMITTADWREVDTERGVWTVPKEKMKSKSSNAKPFTPYLSDRAVETFRRRWREQGEPTEGWVFPSRRHRGKFRDDFGAKFAAVLKRAGIKDIVIHDLRRTQASYAAIAGASIGAISKMLGHASLQPTMIYARLYDAAVSEAARASEEKMETISSRSKSARSPS